MLINQSTIPMFPQWNNLRLLHKTDIDKLNDHSRSNFSVSNFTNLFVLDTENQTQVTQLNQNIVVKISETKVEGLYTIIGKDKLSQTIKQLNQIGKHQVTITGVPFAIGGALADPPQSDYIYSIDQINAHSGKVYAGFRRHLNTFRNNFSHTSNLQVIQDTHLIWELQQKWRREHSIHHDSLNNEESSLEKLIQFTQHLNVNIQGVFINNHLASFVISEVIPQKTVLIHFFKSLRHYPGLAEFTFLEFARTYQDSCSFINFEQDLGQLGLKQFKSSLNPLTLATNYTVTLPHQT